MNKKALEAILEKIKSEGKQAKLAGFPITFNPIETAETVADVFFKLAWEQGWNSVN